MSKLKDPDFLNIFQNYDILFSQETKTDNLDYLALPDGFTYVAKHGNKCLKKSGGIVTIFKKVFQIYLNSQRHLLNMCNGLKLIVVFLVQTKLFCLAASIFPRKHKIVMLGCI